MSERVDDRRRRLLQHGGLATLLALAGCSGLASETDDPDRVDDWQYEPTSGIGAGGSGGNVSAGGAPRAQGADGGFAVGGAKDVNNFRQNVEEGYLPLPTDVSYEGLFYDYRFDTAAGESCSTLFCPSYATATTADPLSGETERYMTVGLNSNLAPEEVERPPLNLVVVLDTSGSMRSGFGEYYYDLAGNKHRVEDPDQPKMDVAREALADLTRQLEAGDRFGIVTYNNSSQVAKPLRRVEETDMEAIRGHFSELEADGGTNLAAGLEEAAGLLSEYGSDPERETRTIVLTDAMPNIGTRSESGLRSTLSAEAEQGRHVTFVGVGVDFNTEIVDAITEVRGANYYSVRSPEQFQRRLGNEFTYMVTPMVFDLSVEVEGPLELQRVYGTTAADEATGQVLYARTLFPSPTSEEGTKGGVILAKVRRTGAGEARLTAEWEDRAGERGSTSARVEFPDVEPEQFESTAVRKAVLLARYADLVKSWAIDERERDGEPRTSGVRVPERGLGEWERQSTDLRVSEPYRERFGTFADYFEAEMRAIGDDALATDLELLRTLAAYGESRPDGRVPASGDD